MPLDVSNPEFIKVLVECYEKTARNRMVWNQKNHASIIQAATLHREEKGYYETDVLKEAMAGGMPTITREHKLTACNKKVKPIRDAVNIPGIAYLKKEHSVPEVGLGNVKEDPRLGRPDTDLTLDPIMRPVHKKQRKIIYKDIPKFGREVYLTSRFKNPPEERYYFRETSGWQYGWRLKDSYFGNNAPRCGRVWRLTRNLQSRSGPHSDPHYYRNPNEIADSSKCPDI